MSLESLTLRPDADLCLLRSDVKVGLEKIFLNMHFEETLVNYNGSKRTPTDLTYLRALADLTSLRKDSNAEFMSVDTTLRFSYQDATASISVRFELNSGMIRVLTNNLRLSTDTQDALLRLLKPYCLENVSLEAVAPHTQEAVAGGGG